MHDFTILASTFQTEINQTRRGMCGSKGKVPIAAALFRDERTHGRPLQRLRIAQSSCPPILRDVAAPIPRLLRLRQGEARH